MIIESENGTVSSVDLINIGMDLTKKISAQAAQVDMLIMLGILAGSINLADLAV